MTILQEITGKTSSAQANDTTIDQVIERFWETVPSTWGRIRGHLRATAAEHFNLTVEQFHILRHIRRGIHSVSELAEVKQISRPAISQAVDTLVEKGLITRQQSEEDRRFVRLDLTENGSTLINAVFQENRAWMKEKMARLSEEDAALLENSFQLLKDIFSDTGEPCGPGAAAARK
ncbi:MAG TPA: MarR family transcriptional regulator [Anaerolineaceae bacterium]